MSNKDIPTFRVIIIQKDEKTGRNNLRPNSAETSQDIKEILIAYNITSLNEVIVQKTNIGGQDEILDLSTLLKVKLTATWEIKK